MNRTFRVIITMGLATLTIGIVFFFPGSGGQFNIPAILGIVRDPITLAIIGSIFTFLIIDRWKRLEDELSQIRQNQTQALKDIIDFAKDQAALRKEELNRKAEAIDTRIEGLLEDHPWIADITENEFIPDASSCRIVLITAQDLFIKGKIALVYEYLFTWVDEEKKKRIGKLQGTADDFLDLTDFCERVLGDEYLGFLIIGEAYKHATNRHNILPDYLRRLVRHGRFADTEGVAKQLRRMVHPSPVVLFFNRLRNVSYYQRASFLYRGFAALAIFEKLAGNESLSDLFVEKAMKNTSGKAEKRILECVKAEMHIIIGDFENARKIVGELYQSSNNDISDDVSFEVARIYRSLGDLKTAYRLMSNFQSIPTDTLAEASHGNLPEAVLTSSLVEHDGRKNEAEYEREELDQKAINGQSMDR